MALEKPVYSVIKKEGKFELRRYGGYISAQVKISARDYREAANRGFGPLASFIFGGNISKQKIAMTAPVSAEPNSEKIAMTAPVIIQREELYTVSFVIPRKYTLETLPIPLDERITFCEHAEKQIAVLRFSGAFNQKNFEKNILRLQAWIEKEGMKAKGEASVAGYNPPFVPWFLKHNEILIEV